jgi:hypothetical protein
MDNIYGNLLNYQPMPLIENYKGLYFKQTKEGNQRTYDNIPIEFNYSDGTSDSYVKRGFDEDYVQRITRYEGLEQSYRIFTTNTILDFQPRDKIQIGDRTMFIIKVLPLLNTNDNIRQYNFSPDLYRRFAVKLIYLE